MTNLPDLSSFAPSRAQARAKARLDRQLAARAGLVDLAALTLNELTQLAGDRRVAEWLRDPAFAAWFTDRDSFVDEAVALKDLALRVVEDILLAEIERGVLTAKDKLAAANMLFQLTGSFPKAQPVVFADKALDAMSDADVQAELAKLTP
jgi:hypothetical protein